MIIIINSKLSSDSWGEGIIILRNVKWFICSVEFSIFTKL